VDTGQDRTPSKEKLRTQRILGKLLKDSELKGGDGSNQYAKVPKGDFSKTDTLADLGVTKKQSSTFQQIAVLIEQLGRPFEDHSRHQFHQPQRLKVNYCLVNFD